MNPILMNLLAGIVNMVPGAVNSIASIVKDKKNAKAETSQVIPALMTDKHNIADGIDLSGKSVIGYGIGGAIITYALTHEPVSIWVLAIGAAVLIATIVAKAMQK